MFGGMTTVPPGSQPHQSTGMLHLRLPGSSQLEFLGSCFLFVSDDVCLTAAHCLPDDPNDLLVAFPMLDRNATVKTIHRHWTADVALLRLVYDSPPGNACLPFRAISHSLMFGMDFMAFGYPSEASLLPTARLFKGHIQRLFPHVPMSDDGPPPTAPWYQAAEMSIPAPTGPVFHPSNHDQLFGLVTANNETSSLRTLEEVTLDDSSLRLRETREIVSYGIFLVLQEVSYWLKWLVPEHFITAGPPEVYHVGIVVRHLVEQGGAAFHALAPELPEKITVWARGEIDSNGRSALEEFADCIGVALTLAELSSPS